MKKLKRILSVILVVALSVGVLVACSKASADEDANIEKCKDVVKDYFGFVVDGKYTEAAALFENVNGESVKNVNRVDQLVTALKTKLDIKEQNSDEKLKSVAKLLIENTKQIQEAPTKSEDGTYTVVYKVEYLDSKKIESQYAMELKDLVEDGNNVTDEEKITALSKVIKDNPDVKKEQSFTVTLKDVEGKMKIVSEKINEENNK